MSNKRISKKDSERCLLTESAPFETPTLFSNWGSYNYFHNLKKGSKPYLFRAIFEEGKVTIPYNFRIKKDFEDFRTLSLIHPSSSKDIIDLYKLFDTMIIRSCMKSKFSIRRPFTVAKYYVQGKANSKRTSNVEQYNEKNSYASSYFSYKDFSQLYKFYDSEIFANLEKKFSYMEQIDISKCFPSIYTHSISWALRGKIFTKNLILNIKKDKSLGGCFDKLMQKVNYNETHGIVIGPEFSRIFAEIILQEIDSRIERKMSSKGYSWGIHYYCVRYVDDSSVFFNSQVIAKEFTSIVKKELEQYKLYLNDKKTKTYKRPFITEISKNKIMISRYVKEFSEIYMKENEFEKINTNQELNKVRMILSNTPDDIHALTSFFLSSINKKLILLKEMDPQKAILVINTLIDMSFHWVRMDIRVITVYRLTAFVLGIKKQIESFPIYLKKQIENKMYIKILSAIENSLSEESILEAMNLIILAKEFVPNNILSPEMMSEIIEKSKHINPDDKNEVERLSYFSIVSILYYIEDIPIFKNHKNIIIDQIKVLLHNCSYKKYSETAHLICDILSSPTISEGIKMELLDIALKHEEEKYKDSASKHRYINYAMNNSWFFNWNQGNELELLLKKKRFLLTY